jgi:multicomponent Na+:H+ antiporter subunit A
VLQLVALHFIGALAAPVLVRRWGRGAFLPLAAIPGAAAVWALTLAPAVLEGDPARLPSQTVPWVPSIGLALDVRLDSLSWLMVLLVGGIGALVLLYCAAYFSSGSAALGRFAGVFVAFAGAMLAVVTTDNVLALYVAWELTTVFSYLLIGHYFDRKASRRAAMQAIVVTTLGGLAMLAGLVTLAEAAGTYALGALVAAPPTGGLAEVAVALVLVGAVTKSALVPFHFWLPAAMAAPTPVSAYLHAAAMVKAGVYLVARLAPGFAGSAAWQWTVLGLGSATLLLGGYRSLRQHDLKLLLAFGTVSQLGLLVVLVGRGTQAVALAGLALLGAHAMFKASLFLVVGAIDDATGTRDLRELSGLGRRLPLLSAAGVLATASMIGLPPFAGYVAKEAALDGLWYGGAAADRALLAVVVLGSILTVAYGLRFVWGAFGTKPGVEPQTPDRPAALLLLPPALLAVGGLVAGVLPGLGEALLAPYADTYPAGEPGHLTLWAGWGVPVGATSSSSRSAPVSSSPAAPWRRRRTACRSARSTPTWPTGGTCAGSTGSPARSPRARSAARSPSTSPSCSSPSSCWSGAPPSGRASCPTRSGRGTHRCSCSPRPSSPSRRCSPSAPAAASRRSSSPASPATASR